MRSEKFRNRPRRSQHLMEPEGSLSYSQGLTTSVHPNPEDLSLYTILEYN
jgi:hypothetical protein